MININNQKNVKNCKFVTLGSFPHFIQIFCQLQISTYSFNQPATQFPMKNTSHINLHPGFSRHDGLITNCEHSVSHPNVSPHLMDSCNSHASLLEVNAPCTQKLKHLSSRQEKRTQLHKRLNVLPTIEHKKIPTTSFMGCKVRQCASSKLIYIDTFDVGEISYMITQSQNCEAYIGCLIKEEYRIIHKIILDTPLLRTLYFSHSQDQDILVLGCKSGNIFLLHDFAQALASGRDHELTKNVVNWGATMDLESMHLFLDLNKQCVLHIVFDGIKIMQCNFSTANTENVCGEGQIRVVMKSRIKVMKQIKVGSEDCMLVYMQGMHMPGILASNQVSSWFPFPMDQLVSLYNKSLESLCLKTCPHQQLTSVFDEKIDNIQDIQHDQQSNSLIVGCSNGILYFCSILKVSPQFKASGWPFQYILQKRFALQEGQNISSFSLKHRDSYLVAATNAKVIFYDFEQRVKFSQTIKQKESSPINLVKWTIDENLLICSLTSEESKVYLYSKILPIRSRKQP